MEKKMDIQIVLVNKGEKEILRNLLEKYEYEVSQYNQRDVNDLGLFGYDYLDNYWLEENRFPYFIKVDKKLAGFIMVNNYRELNVETEYSIGEYFIVYKYRKIGIGKYVINYIFNKYKGKWQLTYLPENEIAKKFWNKIVNEYTNGKYETHKIKTKYGTIEDVLVFET
jgi:predicted acetyltransferase